MHLKITTKFNKKCDTCVTYACVCSLDFVSYSNLGGNAKLLSVSSKVPFLLTILSEVHYSIRNFYQEVAELQEKIRNTEIRIETAPGPDLEELLNDMRIQYEKMAAKNRAEAEEWYTEKVGTDLLIKLI